LAVLDWLRREKNITAGWVRDPGLRLALDFAEGRLCGIGFGEPPERLAFLGPADRGDAPRRDLEYLDLGLSVGTTDGKIDSYCLWWLDYQQRGYEQYPGSVLLNGQAIALGRATTEPAIVSAFGQPYWKDKDESETILFYELKDHWGRLTERQVELDEEGALKALLVVSEPMLADDEQRRSYGVGRPWPP
jgi:hypothetical protein